MKRSLLLWTVITALSVTLCFAQDKKNMPPGMDEMMQKWMQYITPDEHHKKLDAFAGTWETVPSVMTEPGKDPVTSKGTAEFKWMLGGRYMQQDFSGSMMGMPMNGIGFNGYDKNQKTYFMIWMDNMSTAYMVGNGQFDQSGKTLNLYAKMDDPTTGDYNKNERLVLHWVDDNQFTFTIYDLSGGEDFKVLEMTYTRKK